MSDTPPTRKVTVDVPADSTVEERRALADEFYRKLTGKEPVRDGS